MTAEQQPLKPTAAELQRIFRNKADAAEIAADRRKAQILEATRKDLNIKVAGNPRFYGARNITIELNVMVDKAASTDPVWKRHVALQQWYMQKSMMYGSEAQTELLQQLVNALPSTQIFSSR